MNPYVRPYTPAPPPPHRWLHLSLGFGAGVVITLMCVAAAHAAARPGGRTGPTEPSAPASTSPAAAAGPTSATPTVRPKPRLVLKDSGDDNENTARFDAGTNWTVNYSYDCANAGGGTGNFILGDDNDNDMNFGDGLNNLNSGGHGVYRVYGDPGRHFLTIGSECDWKIKVFTAP